MAAQSHRSSDLMCVAPSVDLHGRNSSSAEANLQTAANADNSVMQEQLRTQAMEGVVGDVMKVVPRDDRDKGEPHVRAILNELALSGIGSKTQAAYILATAQHESGFGNPRFGRSTPLTEERNAINQGSDGKWRGKVHIKNRQVSGNTLEDTESKYWDALYGHKNGNNSGTSDAKDFRGRGYVQLTGRDNYSRMTAKLNSEGFSYTHGGVTYGGPEGQPIDLTTNFEHVNLVPALAARVLVKGSMEGIFTGKGVGDYVNDQSTDFYNARSVINGDKGTNGKRVASMAWRYVAALGSWDKVISLTKTTHRTSGAAGDTGPVSALIDGAMLRKGARGERVRELQRLLNEHGAGMKVDGDFGRATQRALIRFQRQRGIEVDGVAGPEVFQVLSGGADSAKECKVQSTDALATTVDDLATSLAGGDAKDEDLLSDAKALVTGRPILGKGQRGNRVEALQKLLSAAGFAVAADGDFGRATRRAVKAFQLAKGLLADGRVGKQTADALHGSANTTTATQSTSGGFGRNGHIAKDGTDSPTPSGDNARGEAAAKAARIMYAEGLQAHGSGSWETQGSNWGPEIEELKASNSADTAFGKSLPWCGMFVGHQYSQVGIRKEIMGKLVFWSGQRLQKFFTSGEYVGRADTSADSWWEPHTTTDLRGVSGESKRKAAVDAFAPQAGDVVLFRQKLDHVAVVSGYDAGTGALQIMEGNRSNKVQASVYYPARDTTIAFLGRFNDSDFDPTAQISPELLAAKDPTVTHTGATGGIR